MVAFEIILLVLAAILWFALSANVLSMNTSDPAGRGMAQVWGVFTVIALWLLLALLLVIAAARGMLSTPSGLVALVMMPVSAAAAIAALTQVGRGPCSSRFHFRWSMLPAILLPPLILAFTIIVLFTTTSLHPIGLFLWAGVALLSSIAGIAALRPRPRRSASDLPDKGA